MRLQIVHLLLALCSLIVTVHAFTKEDHEIFRLRDELEASEGPDVTFYEFVGVSPGASSDDIQKAFRKKSRAIHPDKIKHNFVASNSVPKAKKAGDKKKAGVHVSKGPSQREIERTVKLATERYQRLGVVAKLLRSPQRERYDHFMRHGFPAWRGTGYYYSRYRPGLGTVLMGLFVVVGGFAHYGALRISYNRQREFMERYIRDARKSAWGDETGIPGIPGVSGPVDVPPQPNEEPDPMANLNRRQKRELERQNKKDKSKPSAAVRGSGGRVLGTGDQVMPTSPTGERRKVIAENGKTLIVDSIGNVFLETVDDEGESQEWLLDLSEIEKPTFRDTAVFRLPMFVFRMMASPFRKDTTPVRNIVIPVAESEDESEVRVLPGQDVDLSVQQEATMMSSSQLLAEEFEIVDSTGVEKDAAAGNNAAQKRGKKKKQR